jgi:hypothetical protein
MTPLRQQMSEAMVLRGLAARTQEAYLAAVVALAKFYRRPPDILTTEQLQAYLLHLITEKKLAYSSVNQASCAFRFLYGSVLHQADVRLDIPMAKVPKRLQPFARSRAPDRPLEPCVGATCSASRTPPACGSRNVRR